MKKEEECACHVQVKTSSSGSFIRGSHGRKEKEYACTQLPKRFVRHRRVACIFLVEDLIP